MNKRIFRFLITASLALSLLAPLPALAKGVVLNFNDVDISTMVKFISDLTGKNFVMDERVKGKISVFSPAKLSSEEAFNLFTSVLELKGFTIVQAGKVNKIVPTASARQSGMKVLFEDDRAPVNEAYVVRLIPLENIPAQDALTFLQPMVAKDGHISAFAPNNAILVVDSELNLQKLLSILKLIDNEQQRQGGEIVFLKNAAADSVAKLVSDWIGGKDRGKPAGAAPTSSTGAQVIPDSRLNALIIFANDRDKEDIKRLITMIDVAPPTTSSKINVYYLENADATEVGKVLDTVVKGGATAQAAPPGGAAPQLSAFEGSRITITPDKATNSLVIMASPTDYQNLLQVIQKLDKRRRQVFVEALIAEVSLDKLRELGVQWGFIGGATTGAVSTVGIYDPSNTLSSFFSLLSTLGSTSNVSSDLGKLSPANFPAVLKALDTNGVINVLSTPNIMTSDNKEAEIFVGENVPFVGKIETVAAGQNTLQSIERKDTGITLKLTPQISEGEYIKLDIYQEISSVKDVLVGAAKDLATTKRSAKTSVVVKDKDTVAIGGLIQDKEQETISKIPLLGDIPLLGWLFKNKSKKREKTNLMILLTPRIIKGAQEMAEVSDQQKNRFNEAVKTDKPMKIEETLKPKP